MQKTAEPLRHLAHRGLARSRLKAGRFFNLAHFYIPGFTYSAKFHYIKKKKGNNIVHKVSVLKLCSIKFIKDTIS